jgi:hypothetical protein
MTDGQFSIRRIGNRSELYAVILLLDTSLLSLSRRADDGKRRAKLNSAVHPAFKFLSACRLQGVIFNGYEPDGKTEHNHAWRG